MNQTNRAERGADRLSKGTLVRVLTTNGGENFGHLVEAYVPTYRVVFGRMNALTGGFGSYSIVEATRIKSVEAVALRNLNTERSARRDGATSANKAGAENGQLFSSPSGSAR